MGLQLTVNNPHGGTASSAYTNISELYLNRVDKKGYLRMHVWKNEAARIARKKRLAEIHLDIGKTNEFHEDPETREPTDKIRQIAFSELHEKTDANLYSKIKTLKIRLGSQDIDLSDAIDVL